jgi:hypothetical protein
LETTPKVKSKPFTAVAVWLADLAGSTGTFYFLVVWQFGWMALATIGIGVFKKDPYPLVFLLFLSNIVQLFYLPLLQIKARQRYHILKEQTETMHLHHQEVTNSLALIHNTLRNKESS